MSTIGYESWAVDLADVGAVYPFQGGEVLFAVVGIVLWLGWHVLQIRADNRKYDAMMHHAQPDKIKEILDGEDL